MSETHAGARIDETGRALLIETLQIADDAVLREARRWTTGVRGEPIEDDQSVAGADVTAFATEALTLGARALTATAQTVEARALERLVTDVGARTNAATTAAAELTTRATRDATDAIAKVTDHARKAIVEADRTTRDELTTAVTACKAQLVEETRRLFGGDSPELLERLQPVLNEFGTQLEKHVSDGARQLLEQAAKQLDPADPTSPIARHAAGITEQHQQLARRLEEQNTELGRKVDELVSQVKVQDARTRLAQVTPIKGETFEGSLHAILQGVAAGLGDEYTDTTATTGAIPRCKKGDGVLAVGGQTAKVVLEMTDSPRTAWGDYLDEAERNRVAHASLGIVRTPEQNAGLSVRVLGPRRVVLAFDPEVDNPELLRTVVQLLRTVAIAESLRSGGVGAEIATAQERITAALEQLEKISDIKKAAASIGRQVTTIETGCTTVTQSIHRLLDEALGALAGTGSDTTTPGEPTDAAHAA
ncbi:Fis family transcriptional regulator [Cellulomonas alba]|uniref:Fis family transcriptional regulator n=1 Tax=Cellulomonas alba TaxID=3053467 RepID=A0ABT7SBV1_9CELL|nr:Fis family transcriptional regulator [Cellulomonas alba]MDM7853655.1 Fis family transcriptional regulator [Cellulomonas alba]